MYKHVETALRKFGKNPKEHQPSWTTSLQNASMPLHEPDMLKPTKICLDPQVFNGGHLLEGAAGRWMKDNYLDPPTGGFWWFLGI